MNAIGLIEVIGYVGAIEAADVCVKSSNVNIVSIEKVGASIVTLTISGDVGAVNSAIETASEAVTRIATLRSSHVIPKLHEEVCEILYKNKNNDIEELQHENEIAKDIAIKTEEVIEVEIENTNSELEVIETKIEEIQENSGIETSEVEAVEKINIDEDAKAEESDLSQRSVKELKAIARKYNPTIRYKELNVLKKEELINLVKELTRKDK